MAALMRAVQGRTRLFLTAGIIVIVVLSAVVGVLVANSAAGVSGADADMRARTGVDLLASGTFDLRIKATGYLTGANGWSVGENLAWGSGTESTPRQIVAAWMASPPHRRNILDCHYSQIGVAIVNRGPVAQADANAATYTTEFGHRG